jgi:twitching motility protein PilT
MELAEILQAAVKHGASDVHIVPGRPPFLRINGRMRSLSAAAFSREDTERMILGALREDLVERFRREAELDTSFEVDGSGRFRLNVFEQKDGLGAVFRVIATAIPEPGEIGLDETLLGLTDLPRGIVLVTGPTGSGKSTTLASLINTINKSRKEHILTIEDPIEYMYPKLSCVVTQREVGTHSHSFKDSLKRALRQDPDVILVGEMRDLETIGAALTLAETGHLVFSTLHTTDAAQTVDRIIDVFPPFQQQQVRIQLAGTLKAVVCQQLLPLATGKGRVAAREVLIVNSAVANLIREGKTHQIYSAIEVGAKFGMKSLDSDLARLVREGTIDVEAAIGKANSPDAIKRLAGGAGS